MSEPMLTADLLTYSEAAEVTGLSRNYIANLVSQGTLHSKRVDGRHSKYLLKEEVEWLRRRRSGVNEPNPVADGNPQVISASTNFDASLIDAALREETLSPVSATEIEPSVGLAFAMLVLGLLLALVLHNQPNQEQLERFKQAPELKPLRQAILKLAGELDAA